MYFKWFLFLFPCQKHEVIYLWCLLWETSWVPGGKTHKILGAPLWLGLPGMFTSQTCPHWASSNSSMPGQFFLPWHWLHGGFHMWTSAHSRLWLPLFAYLSLWSWGQQFPLCPPTLTNPKIVDFSVCSAFCSLFEQSGDFQGPYAQNLEPEVQFVIFWYSSVRRPRQGLCYIRWKAHKIPVFHRRTPRALYQSYKKCTGDKGTSIIEKLCPPSIGQGWW